jgi:hypothetical protein
MKTTARPALLALSVFLALPALGAQHVALPPVRPLGPIIGAAGDSTLFVDPVALALVVIDPNGTIARIMSLPRPASADPGHAAGW